MSLEKLIDLDRLSRFKNELVALIPRIDTALTQQGQAADAKATGDALDAKQPKPYMFRVFHDTNEGADPEYEVQRAPSTVSELLQLMYSDTSVSLEISNIDLTEATYVNGEILPIGTGAIGVLFKRMEPVVDIQTIAMTGANANAVGLVGLYSTSDGNNSEITWVFYNLGNMSLATQAEIPTNVSDLTNDSGFVNAAGAAAVAPVKSVNGNTGAVSLTAADVGAGTYSKPSGGIPKTDLATAVQTSLDKADTALQSVPSTYRTAAAQDAIDAAQDTAISGKLSTTGDAYRAASIPMGQLDSGSTATVMTATVPGITELRDGVCMWLQNGVISSASGVTLNVNSLGAKPIYNSLSGAVVTTTFTAASTYLFVYNSTRVTGGCWDMVYGYDTNTTYTPPKLGFGYGTCTTAAATAAKTASISSYALVAGGIVAIKFSNDVPAGATLNINSKGAKAIYYKGAAITAGVIKAGDTVTMIYSTYYHVISIDRDADTLPPSPSNASPQSVTGAEADPGTSLAYARADHVHRLYGSTLAGILDEDVVAHIDMLIIFGDVADGAAVVLRASQPGAGYLSYEILGGRKHSAYFLVPLVSDPQEMTDFRVVSAATTSKAEITANGVKLQFNGIADGKLYSTEIELPSSSDNAVGTLSVTDLALPSAQGVSF